MNPKDYKTVLVAAKIGRSLMPSERTFSVDAGDGWFSGGCAFQNYCFTVDGQPLPMPPKGELVDGAVQGLLIDDSDPCRCHLPDGEVHSFPRARIVATAVSGWKPAAGEART